MGQEEKPNDEDNWDPRDLENEEEEDEIQLQDNVSDAASGWADDVSKSSNKQ